MAVVSYAESKKMKCDELSLDELKTFYPGFGEDVREVFSVPRSVERKRTSGSTHPEMVRRQMDKAKRIRAESAGPSRRRD